MASDANVMGPLDCAFGLACCVPAAAAAAAAPASAPVPVPAPAPAAGAAGAAGAVPGAGTCPRDAGGLLLCMRRGADLSAPPETSLEMALCIIMGMCDFELREKWTSLDL